MQLSGELMIMVPLPGGASRHLRLGYKYLDTNAPETGTHIYTYLDSGYKRQEGCTIYFSQVCDFKHFTNQNIVCLKIVPCNIL